jgi:hypothetical protein
MEYAASLQPSPKGTPRQMDQAAFPYHPDQAKTPYFIDIATSLT